MGTWRAELPLVDEYVDYLGHITATAHLALFEQSRTLWLSEITGELEPAFAVIRQELDYRHELLTGDGPVRVDLRVVRLSRSTVTIEERLESASGDLRTESHAIFARWDRSARRSMPFLPAERDRLLVALS